MEQRHHAHQPRNDYGRFIATVLLCCLLAAAGYALQHTISCMLLSWIIAYLLDPLLVRVEQRGLPRNYALGLLYVILLFAGFFFLAFILPAITISWNGFIHDLPAYIQKLKQVALDWKGHIPDRYGSEEIQWLIDKVTATIDTATEKAALGAYTFGTRIIFNLFNIVLSPILVFFMLFYKLTIIDAFKSWLPDGRRIQVIAIAQEVNSSIGGYLRGQVVVSIIVAVLASVALLILGTPHPFFCGIFAGAASVLPFIGVILATLPALFFSWFQYQSVSMLGQAALTFAVIYFVEGYLVKPLVFKESMNLNPLLTIIMVMALGETLGFWGILLALPIASAIKITWGHVVQGDFDQR